MTLSYSNLLHNLALDYNNTLLYYTNIDSNHIKKIGCENVHRMSIANNIQKKDEHLQEIEDEMLLVMMLRKRKRSDIARQQSQSKKRGKYGKNTLYTACPDVLQKNLELEYSNFFCTLREYNT